ncbi:MAG: type I-E CRISPR-associated endoribonuclease Cas2 [Magnetococcales bacterium]|nr:type I-E CRISPR-associated endoribonuclease Cas2 [Magnetococcales bacterium]
MTIIITRQVADRFRGFLSSCMLEIAPGVYTSPRMNVAVRTRVWTVLEAWFTALGEGSIVLVWRDPKAPSGQSILTLGTPPVELVNVDGMILSRRPLTQTEQTKLAPKTDPAVAESKPD